MKRNLKILNFSETYNLINLIMLNHVYGEKISTGNNDLDSDAVSKSGREKVTIFLIIMFILLPMVSFCLYLCQKRYFKKKRINENTKLPKEMLPNFEEAVINIRNGVQNENFSYKPMGICCNQPNNCFFCVTLHILISMPKYIEKISLNLPADKKTTASRTLVELVKKYNSQTGNIFFCTEEYTILMGLIIEKNANVILDKENDFEEVLLEIMELIHGELKIQENLNLTESLEEEIIESSGPEKIESSFSKISEKSSKSINHSKTENKQTVAVNYQNDLFIQSIPYGYYGSTQDLVYNLISHSPKTEKAQETSDILQFHTNTYIGFRSCFLNQFETSEILKERQRGIFPNVTIKVNGTGFKIVAVVIKDSGLNADYTRTHFYIYRFIGNECYYLNDKVSIKVNDLEGAFVDMIYNNLLFLYERVEA